MNLIPTNRSDVEADVLLSSKWLTQGTSGERRVSSKQGGKAYAKRRERVGLLWANGWDWTNIDPRQRLQNSNL